MCFKIRHSGSAAQCGGWGTGRRFIDDDDVQPTHLIGFTQDISTAPPTPSPIDATPSSVAATRPSFDVATHSFSASRLFFVAP